MIRKVKNLIDIRHILAALLICALITPFFFCALVPSAEAISAKTCAANVASDERAVAAINAGRVIHVAGWDSDITQGSSITKKITSNPKVTLHWELERRFYTLSEAFWYIHSGGQDGHTASDNTNQAAWQRADWVILVKGIQQFKTGGSDMKYSLAQIQSGLNPCYPTTDKDGAACYTYGIDGRVKYTETKKRSSSTADGYSVTPSWSTGALYAHSGIWFITGYGNGFNYHGDSSIGSKIYFNLGSSLYFTTGGPVHFSNIDLITNKNVHFYGEEGFYVGSNVLTPDYTYKGSGDSTASNNKYMFSIYAGPAITTPLERDCEIILNSGKWRTIMGGSDVGNIVGDVTISLSGDAYVYSNITAGFDKKVTGNVNIYLANKFLAFLYPSPRAGGTVTGSTNIYLLNGCTVYQMSDLSFSSATSMGAVNVTIEEGARLLNCSSKWQNSNLSGGNVTASLTLSGYQGGFRDQVSFAGFDKITLSNGTKISYRSTFLSGSSLVVNKGCNLYLSNYTSDANLKTTVTSLTKNGTIRYVLVYYVDQASSPSSLNYTYISNFAAENPTNGKVSLGIDGYTPETAFQSLAAAYAAADTTSLKVDCEFIISGNTTEPAALKGNTYTKALPNHTVTISAIDNSKLTLPDGSTFGYKTVLESISLTSSDLYAGVNLTVNEGTVFTKDDMKLRAGWYTANCTSEGTITLNASSIYQVWLGNPAYDVGNVTLNINNNAFVREVCSGNDETSGNLTINVNGTGTASAPNLRYVHASPYTGTVGSVTVNLYSGALGLAGDAYPGNIKLWDYEADYTGGFGTVTGDIVVNITDDFVVNTSNAEMFYNRFATPDKGTTIGGQIIVNLLGWTEEFTASNVAWLPNVDKLAAKSYNGVATNTVCYSALPTRLISDASNTETYGTNIDADSGNQMHFHNDAYDYLIKTATSGGTLKYGHDLTSVVASKDATSSAKGNVAYCSCQDPTCKQYFASVAAANAGTQIPDHNADGKIDINDVYRYWYTVTIREKTNDGGDGGSFDVLTVGGDERYDLPAITATANTYYSFTNYFANEGCTTAASSLGVIDDREFTPNGTSVRNASGSKTGGNVNVYGLFTRNLSTLTIDRNAAEDTTQVFVYTISMPHTAALPGRTLTVTVTGNESVVITDLPQGVYTVTQDNGWSWRYADPSQTITFNRDMTATFNGAVVDTNRYWLDANSAVVIK